MVLAGASALSCSTACAQDQNGAAKGKELSKAFRAAAHNVIPTVVKIKNISKGKRVEGVDSRSRADNLFRGTPFEDFFDGDELPPGTRFHGFIPPRMGVGSGVIIDPKGIILTNNHVVEGADEVIVELVDGRQLKATDIKSDVQSDLAVLRVKANATLPAATLGDSDAMDIGDWVIAIGCPFELDSTVSAGIISGKGRSLSRESRAGFLQTDAAINPGNSGGPLVNLDGEVIGINTAIESSTGTYEGIGFAIPSNLVKWVALQLVKSGAVERSYLGVHIGEINAEISEHLGVPLNAGVIVSEVIAKSPAADAGLKERDVISAFAGKKIANTQQLQEIVERTPKGSVQQLDILRDGKPIRLQVALGVLPDKLSTNAGPLFPHDSIYQRGSNFVSKELGIELRGLTPEAARKLGLGANSGVIVTAVEPDGISAPAGIREGMIILFVGQKPVHSVTEFKAAMQEQSLEKGILLLVRTSSGNRFLLVK
jgi:serine protease Do